MATKPKRPVKYDLKSADRRRNLLIQIGLTAVVVIFAVALVLYIVISKDKSGDAGSGGQAIRVTAPNVITTEGTAEPKAVLSLYEDFLCPACGNFEQSFGPTITKLIDSGAIAADYHMVAILDRPQNQNYSSRSGAAAYCVADESSDAFRRFHAALYSKGMQPSETGSAYPDDARLIEVARLAGAAGAVPACINEGKYLSIVDGMAKAAGINATPTVRINGEDYDPTTPDALIAKIKEIVGDVPGLDAGTPAPS